MTNNLRILHIYDTSGAGSIMAQYQRKLGHDVRVISNKRLDKFGISEFYNADLYNGSSLGFYLYAIKTARNYDVLHVHSLVRIAPYLKLLYPFKKLILQFHGSDMRIHGRSYKTILAMLCANILLITTKDLWDYIAPEYKELFNECLNIPDTDMFSKTKIQNNNKWLTFVESGKWTNSQIMKDKEVIVIDRSKNPIPYQIMKNVLSDYEGYIDIKIQNDKPLQSLSKTGLEALAMGLKVMNYKGEIITGLPQENNPYYQAEHLNTLMGIENNIVI